MSLKRRIKKMEDKLKPDAPPPYPFLAIMEDTDPAYIKEMRARQEEWEEEHGPPPGGIKGINFRTHHHP